MLRNAHKIHRSKHERTGHSHSTELGFGLFVCLFLFEIFVSYFRFMFDFVQFFFFHLIFVLVFIFFAAICSNRRKGGEQNQTLFTLE